MTSVDAIRAGSNIDARLKVVVFATAREVNPSQEFQEPLHLPDPKLRDA